MAQQNKEQRIIEIVVDGQKANASIKEMSAAAAVMSNQLKKMAADDPKREELIKQLQEMRGRLKEATDEVNGLNKAQVDLKQTEEELHQANLKIIADGTKINASLTEMKAAAGLLEKQLADMAVDDPNREKLAANFRELKTRIQEVADATFKNKEAQVDMHQVNQQIIADGTKMSASLSQMKEAAALMEKQLLDMSADDPNRQKLAADFREMKTRIEDTTDATYKYKKSQEELHQETVTIIADGKKLGASFDEMEAAAKAMEKQLKSMSANDPGRGQLVKEFNDLKDRAKEASNEINGIAKAQSGFAGFMKNTWSTAFGFILGGGLIGITQQLWGIFTSSKTAFEESALINSQLEASLKSTGESAGVTKEMIEELASVQMGKTLFDDDVTKKAASLLLTFTDIKNGVFQEALPAIQDMAQKMAGDGPADLKGATIQVGKALNDPIKGISALSKVGVSFTEQQKSVIKSLVETGDKAGAQRMILAELNKEFGGLAEAARKAAGGMGELKMQMGEAQEELGSLVHEGLEVLAPLFLKAFNYGAQFLGVIRETPKFIRENWDIIVALGAALVTFNGAQIAASASTLYHAAVTKGTTIATNAQATAQRLLNLVMNQNPIARVVTIVAALAGGFMILYNRSQTVRAGIAGIWEVLKNLGGRLADLFTGLATGNWSKVKAAFSNIGGSIAESFNKGYDDKVAAEEVARLKKEMEKHEGKKKQKEKEAIEIVDVETAAEKKAREKAEKERQKAAKKAAEEREKLQKEHQEKLKQERETFAKAEAVALKEENEKKLKEIEEQTKKEEELRYKLLLAYADMDVAKAAKSKNLEAMEKAEQARLALKMENELRNEQLTSEEKILIQQQYEQQRLDLSTQYSDLRNKSEREKAVFVIEQMQAAAQMFFDFKKIASDKELAKVDQDKTLRLKKLEDEFNKGRISKEAYESSKSAIESNYDEKTRELKRKAAKDEKAANVANSIMAGVLAVLKAAPNIPLQILTGIFAAASTAKILATPIPAFAKGGLTSNDLMGMANGKSGGSIGTFADGGMVNNARLGLIGEKGAELVIPNWMIKSPKYANTVGWLESERQRGVAAFATGGPTTGEPIATVQEIPGLSADGQAILAAIQAMHSTVQEWPTKLQVHNNVVDADEKLQEYYDLQDQASG